MPSNVLPLQGLRPFLIGVVAPICAYFALRALGRSDFFALAVGAGIAAAEGLLSLALGRRRGWLSAFVCAMFVVTGAVAYFTHDPRVFLLKASIASGAMGAFLIALSALQPTLGRALAPLVARGSVERAARWTVAWRAEASLRRKLSLACALAGVALLTEAAGRAAIVFSFPIRQSLFLAHGPAVILVAVLIVILRFMVIPAIARAMAQRTVEHR